MRFSAFAALFVAVTTGASAFRTTVTTPRQGKFVGHSFASGDQFFGIPYAQPPLGPLRFAKTKALPDSYGVRQALNVGPPCTQGDVVPIPGGPPSEDCLTLNIYRPPIQHRRCRLLPVAVYIHGGSWTFGGGQEAQFNGSSLVTRSVQLGEPIIYLSLSYRLGVFGWLSGPEVDAADRAGTAALNAGYWDQRTAIKWVKANIASFGGDPDKITIFGESAGANSVAAQMLANGGRVGNLFRGAILQSGSQATGPRYRPTDVPIVRAYDTFLQQTGCRNLACLRTRSPQQLLAAQLNTSTILGAAIPWMPVRDRFFVQELPSVQYAAGRFPNIPFIAGTCLDEATPFVSTNVTDDAGFARAVLPFLGGPPARPFPSSFIPRLQELYPNDPAVGSPFDARLMGAENTDRFFPPTDTNQFKRLAAVVADGFFSAPRRQQLEASVGRVRSWSYLFAQPWPNVIFSNPEDGLGGGGFNRPSSGVFHGTDMAFSFGMPPGPYLGPVGNASTAAAAAYAGPADIKRSTDVMTAAFIHFFNRLSPAGRDVPAWPTYGNNANMLQVQGVEGTRLIRDDFRKEQIQFFLDSARAFDN